MKYALIATPLALIALAGCGNGDDAADAENVAVVEAIPKAEWIEQADAICQQTDEQVGAIDQPSNLEDVGRVADEIQQIVSAEFQQLSDLPPPDEIGEEVEQMLDLEELEVKSFDAIEDAARSGDRKLLASVFEETQQPGDESNRIAKNLGMEECEEPYG